MILRIYIQMEENVTTRLIKGWGMVLVCWEDRKLLACIFLWRNCRHSWDFWELSRVGHGFSVLIGPIASAFLLLIHILFDRCSFISYGLY